jgi:hypothetical protein
MRTIGIHIKFCSGRAGMSDDVYRNGELLDVAAAYDLDTDVAEHIPYPDGTVHISGLRIMTADAEGHVYPLDADGSRFAAEDLHRRGHVIDDRDALGACHAGQQYLDNLADAGYDGRAFDDADAFREYVNETATSGLFWPQLFPRLEPCVVDNDTRLDVAVQDILDDHRYTAFTSHGSPEHAVETLAALVTTPYDEREAVHADHNHVDIPADTSVAALLDD